MNAPAGFEVLKLTFPETTDYREVAMREAEKLHRFVLDHHGRSATSMDGMGRMVDVANDGLLHRVHETFWLNGDEGGGPGVVGVVLARPGEVRVCFHHHWPFSRRS